MTKYIYIAGILLFAVSLSQAGPISAGAFSAGVTLIDFDSLAGGVLVTNQYAGQGVTLSNATATVDTFSAASVPSASPPNMLFVYQGGGSTVLPPLSILFSVPVTRVGFDFATSARSFLTITAFDSANAVIESLNFVGSSIPLGLGGFAGIEEPVNIARIDVSSHPNADPGATYNYVMDNLRFEEGPPIPEPASGLLLAAGLALLAAIRKRA